MVKKYTVCHHLSQAIYVYIFIDVFEVAYNRVALTEYFQHRNVEKLYLNQGTHLHTAVAGSRR